MNLSKISIEESEYFLPFIHTVNENLALISDIGQRKQTNQDFGKIGIRDDGVIIMIVADGVSCSQNPSHASEQACLTLYEILNNSLDFNQDLLNYAINMADISVKNLPFIQQHRLDGPETTIVCAIIKNNKALIGWVGDSRAYTISSQEVKLLTEDDSWSNKMIKEKKMSYDEIKKSSKSHVITQCLGLRNFYIDIHTIEVLLRNDEALMLCSDGLWNMINIKKNSFKNSAEIEAWLMVSEANRAGGKDNITLALNKPIKNNE